MNKQKQIKFIKQAEIFRWRPIPNDLSIHSTPTCIHPSFRCANFVYLQYLQHKLYELTPSKYNIISHKIVFMQCKKIHWKLFLAFKIFFFLVLKFIFMGLVSIPLRAFMRSRGERPCLNFHTSWNFHFELTLFL